ncbi:MAG: hypothetical protein JXQ90_06835 [Cyclobacteriaceae bacterium]
MNRSFLGIALLMIVHFALAQSHDLGLNPPKTEWKQIDTDQSNVIFQAGQEAQAQRVTQIIKQLSDNSFYAIGDLERKVDIILQNQSITPNGFVTVGPYRSEFYTTAPQYNFGGAVDWLDMLAIHEYRHVQQFNNARKGISKVASWVMGDYAWATMAGLAWPRWFFEGDAVYTETSLTNAGRGRMPAFKNEYRSIFLSGAKPFKYDKAAAGSLKQFVPNHYTLGYYLTTHLRNQYGPDAWEDILDKSVRYKGLLFPFSRALKKKTGLKTPKLYLQMVEELTETWSAEPLSSQEGVNQINQSKKKSVTSYRNAAFISDTELVVQKSGYDLAPTIYQTDLNGNEARILKIGYNSRHNITLKHRDNKIYWAENTYDPRWANKEYSVVMSYDILSKKTTQLTTQTKYFAPDVSPEAKQLVVVSTTPDYSQQLHVLDANTGVLISEIPNSDNYQYSFPGWADTNNVAVIVRKDSKNAIALINVKSGLPSIITPFWHEQIGYLSNSDDHIYFAGIFDGTDNIYALEKSTRNIYKITSSHFGATMPIVSPNGKQLVYSDFTSNGYDLKMIELNPSNWQHQTSLKKPTYFFEQGTNTTDILNDLPDDQSEIKAFKGTIPKVHSWNPLYFHPNVGIQVYANNLMSTFSTIGEVSYNINEETYSYQATASYGKFYPVISLDLERANRSRPVSAIIEPEQREFEFVTGGIDWIENNVGLSFTLPWNLTYRNYRTKLWLTNGITAKQLTFIDFEPGTNELFSAYTFSLDYYTLKRTPVQQLNYTLGVAMTLNINKTLMTAANDSYSVNFRSSTFLPSIFRNHSVVINLDYHSEPFESVYKFQDNVRYARGYIGEIHSKMSRIGINYALPLLYPDLALGPIMFIKRVKLNSFYDMGIATLNATPWSEFLNLSSASSRLFTSSTPRTTNYFSSVGGELTFDFRAFRSLEMDLGVRASYLLNDQGDRNPLQFDLVLTSIGL